MIEINSEETKSIIPGKLFEYMVSERPIIGIGPEGADFSKIILETNTGIFVNYAEKEKLKSTVEKYFKEFLEGNLSSNAIGLQNYSRENLTKQLVSILPIS